MAKICEKGLIVKKIGMSRMYDTDGTLLPVTLLKVENQKVTKVLTQERDGYNGFQVGYAQKAEKNLNKPDIFRLRKINVDENFSAFCEFRTNAKIEGIDIGNQLKADLFENVPFIDITGATKGRGFQGSVKRWGSTIGRMTHGSRFHRRPGSLGMRSTPARVFKNKHQPGQMGNNQKTILNLKVLKVDLEQGVIAVKGSVPGSKSGFLEIRPALQAI